MSEFNNAGSLGIEAKQDHPQRVKELAGTDTKYYFSAEELDKMRRATEELHKLKATKDELVAAADGFLLFANEAAADAEFTANAPVKSVLIRFTDPDAPKGDYYRRASDNTTQLLKPESLTYTDTTNDINTDGVANTKAVRDAFKKNKVYNGNQIFDKDNDIVYVDYIISSGGSLATSGTSTGGKVAEIVVDPAKENITLNGIVGIGTAGSFRGRFIDSNGDLIGSTFLLTNPITRGMPSNAAKIQFTILNPSQSPEASNQYDNVMVNYGITSLPYEDYAGSSEKIFKAFDADRR